MIRSGSLEIDPDPAFAGALCAQTDPEAFFPATGESPRTAKRICARCPAREPCLDWALAHDVTGVWGGTTHRERSHMRADRDRKRTRGG